MGYQESWVSRGLLKIEFEKSKKEKKKLEKQFHIIN